MLSANLKIRAIPESSLNAILELLAEEAQDFTSEVWSTDTQPGYIPRRSPADPPPILHPLQAPAFSYPCSHPTFPSLSTSFAATKFVAGGVEKTPLHALYIYCPLPSASWEIGR